MARLSGPKFLSRRLPLRSPKIMIVVGVAVVLSALALIVAFAAGTFISAEPENGTLSGPATVINDSSASGGKAVQFAAASPSCAPGVTGSAPACAAAPPAPAASGNHWNVSFTQEFDGTDYDHTKLTPCFDWNYGGCTSSFNHGYEHYDPGQVQVANGIARLIASPHSPPLADNGCYNGSCTYSAGLLSTARPSASNGSDYLYKFTYGYVESRFKFPATQGFFTAFWMLPADPTYTYRSEIDILEELGNDPTTMFMTYHYNNRSQSYTPNNGQYNNGACPVVDYSKDYVRMGMDWEPGHIAWYINGVKCGEFTNASQIENGPMQLILHMMVSNDWMRSWNVPLLDNTLTRELDVDYIRVYQQAPN